MFGAYGPNTGGRRVRKPDHDSETSDSDDSVDEDHLPSGSEDDEVDDPNVDTARVMRVGGIEIRLDDRGDDSRRGRTERRVVERPDDDDDDDDDDDGNGFFDESDGSESWGSELSLDDDAIDDYVRNCMEGSDSSDADEEADETKEGRRARRESAYLRSMRDMNLSGGEVPSPPASGLDSESEEENEAMKSGDYGDYAWGRGDRAPRGPERLGASGRRAAKKAAKAARKRGESPPDEAYSPRGLPRPGAVAEMCRMLVLSGGAYVGFQPARSHEHLYHLERIANAFGLALELKGGGKRRHPIVRWTPRARAPPADDERVARAVAAAGGEYVPGGHWEGYRGVRERGEGGRAFAAGNENKTLASNFVSAGVMQDGSGSEDGDEKSGASDAGRRDSADAELLDADDADADDADAEIDDANAEIDDADATTRSTPWPKGSSAELELASAGVAVLAEGEDRAVVQADLASNRGLRRAAKAAEREARLLESRRAKLGIRDARSGVSTAGRTVGAGEAFGAFEKHTSGFGSRMLAKMGFQGEGSGVGKGGTGIAEPIAAVTRAKRVGLGAEKGR
jgi:hypothetical protein